MFCFLLDAAFRADSQRYQITIGAADINPFLITMDSLSAFSFISYALLLCLREVARTPYGGASTPTPPKITSCQKRGASEMLKASYSLARLKKIAGGASNSYII